MSDHATTILIERGVYHIGISLRDKDGNIVSGSEPEWIPDKNGGTVIICACDSEREPAGKADIFATWETLQIMQKLHEKLGLTDPRDSNIPDFIRIYKKALADHVDLCDYCDDLIDCGLCIFREAREAADNE